jgi:hypothetical protein
MERARSKEELHSREGVELASILTQMSQAENDNPSVVNIN